MVYSIVIVGSFFQEPGGSSGGSKPGIEDNMDVI